MPKFHRYVQKWCADNINLRKPVPFFLCPADDPLNELAQRVSLRAGSVLLWDQTVVHGSQRKCLIDLLVI